MKTNTFKLISLVYLLFWGCSFEGSNTESRVYRTKGGQLVDKNQDAVSMRENAVLQAIFVKIEEFEKIGIIIRSCVYSSDPKCSLERMEYVKVDTMEELLLGLVNIQRRLEQGLETRKLIFVAKRPWRLLSEHEIFYNDLSTKEDEKLREKLIQAQMQ